jgi:hypothetical protein
VKVFLYISFGLANPPAHRVECGASSGPIGTVNRENFDFFMYLWPKKGPFCIVFACLPSLLAGLVTSSHPSVSSLLAQSMYIHEYIHPAHFNPDNRGSM